MKTMVNATCQGCDGAFELEIARINKGRGRKPEVRR